MIMEQLFEVFDKCKESLESAQNKASQLRRIQATKVRTFLSTTQRYFPEIRLKYREIKCIQNTNGTRDENCACVADAQLREGLTAFYKVKINVTSLKINSKFGFCMLHVTINYVCLVNLLIYKTIKTISFSS